MAKVAIDKILTEMGISGTIAAADAGTVRGHKADLIITTSAFEKAVSGMPTPVVMVSSFVNKDELRSRLVPVLQDLKEKLERGT